jgi:hypothetical protein
MIDFDTSRLPTGSLGWAQLFEAIENALPTDETYWIEFKAGHDAASKEGKAAIAKAIVAFANRPTSLARKWLDGHALIVLGVQPGDVPGAVKHDPATIHQTVQPLLAPPAPGWDLSYHSYKGKQVLVIIVDPPRAGDPIAVIGKSSGRVEDGHVYIRRPGVSERAKSVDIRDLSARLVHAHAPGLDIEVSAAPADGLDGLPIHEWPASWIDSWIDCERVRLMKPLDDFERPKRNLGAELLGFKGVGAFDAVERLSALGLGATTSPEQRTPQEYREEIEAHLDKCRDRLAGFEFEAALAVLPPMVWRVSNLTEHNLTDVKVKIHVEGDVKAYEPLREFTSIRSRVPSAPRMWGPQTKSLFSPAPMIPPSYSNPSFDVTTFSPPKPEITNGGSFEIDFPSVSLRPAASDELGKAVVIPSTRPESLTCTWSATATNISGLVEGAFEIPIRERRVSLSNALQYREPRSRAIRPGRGAQVILPDDE